MAKKLPKGLQSSMDRMGEVMDAPEVGPTTLAAPANQPAPVAPVAPVAEAPAAPVERAPEGFDLPEVTNTRAEAEDLGLSYGDDTPPPDTGRELRVAELALSSLKSALDASERESADLKRQLSERAVPATTSQLSAEAPDVEMIDPQVWAAIMGSLGPAITSLVQVEVARVLDTVDGKVTERMTATSAQQQKQQFSGSLAAQAKQKFNIDFNKVSQSSQFKLFMEERVPGTSLKLGTVLARAYDERETDILMEHIERFVNRYRKPETSATVTSPSGAASGTQFGRGGSAAPARISRAGLHVQLNEARRKRDHVAMGKLNETLDAAEKAGLLVD